MANNGICTKWLVGKGYGFIKVDGVESEVFASSDKLVGGSRLQEGAQVMFDFDESEPRTRKQREFREQGKKVACNVSGDGVIVASQGALIGTVIEWHPGKSYGFILGTDGSRNYVHASAFDGSRLCIGKAVTYDVEDVDHKSGRKVAVNVAGAAVAARGGTRGVVKSWVFNKGFGFVQDVNGNEVFVHASEIDNGWLMAGKELWFDIEEKDAPAAEGTIDEDGAAPKRLSACNVSGDAVRDASTPPPAVNPMGKGFAGKGGVVGKGAVKGGKTGVKAGGKGMKGDGMKGGKVRPGIEKREDTDGKYYTKEEFIQQYGGVDEWFQREETRPSPKNGNYYTRAKFLAYFGGSSEWDAAAPAASSAYAPYSGKGRGGRGSSK